MNHLVIEIDEKNCSFYDAELLAKVCYLNAYRSENEKGQILVVPVYQGSCLAYAQTAAGFLKKTIRGYGIRADGTKFSLLRDKEFLDEPVLVGKT